MPTYTENKKALADLPLTVVSGDIGDTTQWYLEVGEIGATNTQSGKMLLSQFALVIDTDTTATASNVGAGTGLIFKQKTGIDLEFKSLIAGANITINNNASDIEIIAASSGGTSIEDAATTTGLYTEETADQLVGHSANTGTNLIFEMFEGTGTPVSVFQIDGNGDLWNNGLNTLLVTTGATIAIGTGVTHAALDYTTALSNIAIGSGAGEDLTTGDNNILIGQLSGRNITVAIDNVLIGKFTGLNLTNQSGNTLIGTDAGKLVISNSNTIIGKTSGSTLTTGASNIFLGYTSGQYQTTGSNKLIFDNQNRTNAAGELTDSLIVGDFHATVSSQALRFNCGTLTKNGYPILAEDASGDVTVSNEITAADFILA